jgi:hypothetical protein
MRKWLGQYRSTIAFVFIVSMGVLLFWRQDVEEQERTAFDDRRAYDLCVDSNQRTEQVNDRLEKLVRKLVSYNPDDPRSQEFLEDQLGDELPLRDCTALLKSATKGP